MAKPKVTDEKDAIRRLLAAWDGSDDAWGGLDSERGMRYWKNLLNAIQELRGIVKENDTNENIELCNNPQTYCCPGRVGAVMTYSTTGHNRPCGQIIGANGAGDFAVIITGTPDNAITFARRYLCALEQNGYRVTEAHVVPNEDCYAGPQIIVIQTPEESKP